MGLMGRGKGQRNEEFVKVKQMCRVKLARLGSGMESEDACEKRRGGGRGRRV